MLAILIWMGIGTMLATLAVPLLAGLNCQGETSQGALAGMSLGLISALVFGFLNFFKIRTPGIDLAQILIHVSFYAFILSVLAMMTASLLTKKETEKVLNDRQTGWYISTQ